jgi:hypothetical protein
MRRLGVDDDESVAYGRFRRSATTERIGRLCRFELPLRGVNRPSMFSQSVAAKGEQCRHEGVVVAPQNGEISFLSA